MAPASGVMRSRARASPILPSKIWIKLGIGPRKSSSVCSLTAALVERKSAHGNSERHISIVVLFYSRAVERIDRIGKVKTEIIFEIKLARPLDKHSCKVRPYAPVTEFVRVSQC